MDRRISCYNPGDDLAFAAKSECKPCESKNYDGMYDVQGRFVENKLYQIYATSSNNLFYNNNVDRSRDASRRPETNHR